MLWANFSSVAASAGSLPSWSPPKRFKVSCAVKDMKYLYAVWNGTVKNQAILKSLDAERAKFAQPCLLEIPLPPHAGHPRQFLKSAVSRLDEVVGSVHVVDGDVFPNRVKLRLGVFREDEFRHSGGAL